MTRVASWKLVGLGLLVAVLAAALFSMPLAAQDDDNADDDPDNPANQPWIGIGIEGREISCVGIDSPAEHAGLRQGDEMLFIGDTEINGINDVIAALQGQRPGDAIVFKIRRAGEELDIPVTLGSRLDALGPMARGGRTTFLSNAEIFPDLVDYEDELSRRFLAQIADESLNEQWLALLAERRDRREENGDAADPRLQDSTLAQEWERFVAAFVADERGLPGFYKLDRQSYARREPLKFEKVTRDLLGPIEAAAFADTPSVLDAVIALAGGIDITGVPGVEVPPSAGSLDGMLRPLIVALTAAEMLFELAFAELDAEDQAFLATQLPVMAHRFAAHIYLDAGAPRAELSANLRALGLTKRVDYAALAGAIAAPWRVLTPDYLAALDHAVSESGTQNIETSIGVVAVNPAADADLSDAAVILAATSDNAWSADALAAPAFGRTRVLIDFAGDDTYEAGPFAGIAAGLGSNSIVIDRVGDDRYLGHRLTQGAAMLGGGVLWDIEGNDTYLGDAYVGGAALFGIGLLLDSAGNDTRKANLYSWGMGGPKGAGACLDASGEDVSISDAQYPTSYGAPEGEYQGMSFGFGIGFRQIAAGGLGIYADGAGKDIVSAGEFSIGGAYFLGFGAYHDVAGDDIVHSSRYGVGFGVHSAVGIALDDQGNDLYDGQTAASLGSAWDLGVGMLIDAQGDDVYVCDGLGIGGAAQNGFALLWDQAGNDVYRSRGGTQGQGTSFEYGNGRGAKNFGLLWDDAGEDTYNRNLADGETKLRGTIGIAADR